MVYGPITIGSLCLFLIIIDNTIYIFFKEELKKAIRRRKKIRDDEDSDDVDEGLGLPRSPSMHSPIIATGNDPLNKV